MIEDPKLAVALDYETFYSSKDGYSLTNMGPTQYCADPRFDPYLVAICGWEITDDFPFGTWEPGKTETVFRGDGAMFRKLPDGRQLYVGRPESFGDWKNLERRPLCCHNAGFDEVVTLECQKRGIVPKLDGVRRVCTADLAALLMYPRNLKGAMKYMFGKEISKAVRAGMDGRHDYDLDAKDRRDLVEYGGSDAIECHDIWLTFCKDFPKIEQEISEQKREATIRGIKVDVEYAELALKELKRYQAEIVADIPWYPEKPVGSLPALRQAVIALGIEPPKSFKKDDPGFLDWQKEHENIPFIAARQKAVAINMHVARIESLLASVDENGCSHPQFTFYGAHTGRDSGKATVGGGNTNLLNLPRKPILQGDEHVFGGKGVDLRGMYVARPGYKFVIYDYSQIEARFSLWLVDDTHMMEAMKREGNLYQANAVMMGWCQPGEKIKKEKPDVYRLAKCCVLGLGYGMGAAKFVDSCKSQGLELPSVPVDEWPEIDRRLSFIIRNVARIKGDPYSERNRIKVGQLIKSLQIVGDWRNANSRIVAKWKEYEQVFKERIAAGKSTVAFRLPSGRIKRYFDPHLCKEETVEVDENGVEHPSFRVAIKATTVRGNPATFFTGGNIMENIVQASCRDIMAYSAVEVERKHPTWRYVFSVYDEIVFEVPEQEADEASAEIPRIMTKGDYIRDWTEGLALEVEGDVCDRYHK
jgi:hypothetical protein